MHNKALFLDRDGVINHNYGYVHTIEKFDFIDGIFDLARTAHQLNYKIIVVTNQAGIGRGLYSEEDFLHVTKWMNNKFIEKDAPITDVLFCPYHPTEGIGHYKKDSEDRKPNPGMILKAIKLHNIDISNSILIGDNSTDINAGKSAGVFINLLFNPEFNLDNTYLDKDIPVIKSVVEAIPYLKK
jgi:D-glycero-D-manno-heptose 1,7-bisphosphate phosphatase